MQAVMSAPELAGRLSEQHATEMLMRPIAGVPLLLRTVLTASRVGGRPSAQEFVIGRFTKRGSHME
jgi:hypothetical protein